MGEAFILGSGGGATVQHIVMTNATSHTFQLTNPKRTYCMVFGSITSDGYTGSSIGIDDTLECKYSLHGNQYAIYSKHGDRTISNGSWQTKYTESTEFDKDIAITRNNDSITIELMHDYRKENKEGYDSTWDETYTELYRTNTINIYVVDYD